jgi:hypothetical protein
MVPVKSAGFGGAVNVGNPDDMLIPRGVIPFLAQAAVANVQLVGKKENASDSA